MGVRIN